MKTLHPIASLSARCQRFWRIGLLAGLPFLLAGQPQYPQDYFTAPLSGTLQLSGTFAELRGNHFHSGIDLKTGGRSGMPVLAAAEGYVSRIKVSPYGYGRALYLQHPNGYTTVYAHLAEFSPEIEEYLRQEQHRLRRNSLNLYPPAGKFSVKQGEEIALSGNSGGSGAPHLHFEIRDADSKAINPLFFGFAIADSRPPTLLELAAYGYQGEDLRSLEFHKLLQLPSGEYRLAGDGVLQLGETPAFALRAYDQLDAASNRNGYYELQLWVNDSLRYEHEARTFAFAETRYLNSHIDYAQSVCCSKKFARLYHLPNNQFSAYPLRLPLRQTFWRRDTLNEVRIVVRDFAGNESALRFQVALVPAGEHAEELLENTPVFHYQKDNHYQSDQLELQVPRGALYENFYFDSGIEPACADCLSQVYRVASEQIALHRYAHLKLRVADTLSMPQDKLALVRLDEQGQIRDYVGGHYRAGYLEASVRQLGLFAVKADTIPPKLEPNNLRPNQKLTVMDRLYFSVSDDLSGIERYEAYWDEEWLRLYYDYKQEQLIFLAADIRSVEGAHTLSIKVWDERGNRTVESYRVQW